MHSVFPTNGCGTLLSKVLVSRRGWFLLVLTKTGLEMNEAFWICIDFHGTGTLWDRLEAEVASIDPAPLCPFFRYRLVLLREALNSKSVR